MDSRQSAGLVEEMDSDQTSGFSEKMDSQKSAQMWDQVGFHRPLAGFWYQIATMILHIVSASIVTALLYGEMFPFPESMGYKSAATNIFLLFFTAFDLGTANMMARFIGEININNPKKMIQYIQYFIWYQAITGLFQTTAVSLYALFIVPQEQLAYTIWIMLIYCTTQYPGMLSVFTNTLDALQQFDKTQLLKLLGADVVQRITEIIFVFLGKYWGMNNPQYGMILGIAIGLTIGQYVDDFITMIISGFMFNKIMKKYNIRMLDCFRHDFDWKLVKECLIFGFKTGFPSVIQSVVSYIILMLWLNFMPQYTTWTSLLYLALSLVNFLRIKLNLGGAISESFLNGKKNLTQYYVGQSIRFDSLIQALLFSIMFGVILVLEPAFIMANLDKYIYAIPFLIPLLLRTLEYPYGDLASDIIVGTNHPSINLGLSILKMVVDLVFWVLVIVVFQIPQNGSITTIAWIMGAGELVGLLFRDCLAYIYVHKKILPFKIPGFQTVGPWIAAIIIFLIEFTYYKLIFIPMMQAWGTLVGLIPMVLIFIIITPIFIYMPLTVFLGIWDDGTYASFKKAAKMSGYAKFIVNPMYKMLQWSIPKAKLHNRFNVDDTLPLQEAMQLMELKSQNLDKNHD